MKFSKMLLSVTWTQSCLNFYFRSEKRSFLWDEYFTSTINCNNIDRQRRAKIILMLPLSILHTFRNEINIFVLYILHSSNIIMYKLYKLIRFILNSKGTAFKLNLWSNPDFFLQKTYIWWIEFSIEWSNRKEKLV